MYGHTYVPVMAFRFGGSTNVYYVVCGIFHFTALLAGQSNTRYSIDERWRAAFYYHVSNKMTTIYNSADAACCSILFCKLCLKAKVMATGLVVIPYDDVVAPTSSPDLLHKLEQAFGPSGLGIIGIQNVPEFVTVKQSLLPLSHSLAHLPAHELEALEDPSSMYNAGWSHGKEKLKADVPDFAKGSFYFNPIADVPGTADDRATYPVSYPCNKWPTTSLPQLEPVAKQMGRILQDVAIHLSKHIDAYAHSKVPTYAPTTLYDTLQNTEKVKGRLLYYYPLSSELQSSSEDSWIGWHNDSGFLTALAGDLYVDHTTGTPVADIPKEAGLYVVDRIHPSRTVKVDLPSDCMAIQIGECTQILTGGAVVATPHCVRGVCSHNIARASLACFIDTPPTFPLSIPRDCAVESMLQESSTTRVPPLSKRWIPNQTFGTFLQTTFQMYYHWNNES